MTIKIKALHWTAAEGTQVARTPFGEYRFFKEFSPVARRPMPVITFVCCEESNCHLTRVPELTFEAASKIAQDDFNARVMACLE
jgi:hypothetical protein